MIDYVGALSGSKVLDNMIEESEATADGSVLDAILASAETTQIQRNMKSNDLNRVGKTILDAILDSPGSDLPSARGTWWGALNGVTYAVDHQLGKSEDTRLTSAWFGQRASLKQHALNLAYDYAVVRR